MELDNTSANAVIETSKHTIKTGVNFESSLTGMNKPIARKMENAMIMTLTIMLLISCF